MSVCPALRNLKRNTPCHHSVQTFKQPEKEERKILGGRRRLENLCQLHVKVVNVGIDIEICEPFV